jgi:hypothetical protein
MTFPKCLFFILYEIGLNDACIILYTVRVKVQGFEFDFQRATFASGSPGVTFPGVEKYYSTCKYKYDPIQLP